MEGKVKVLANLESGKKFSWVFRALIRPGSGINSKNRPSAKGIWSTV